MVAGDIAVREHLSARLDRLGVVVAAEREVTVGVEGDNEAVVRDDGFVEFHRCPAVKERFDIVFAVNDLAVWFAVGVKADNPYIDELGRVGRIIGCLAVEVNAVEAVFVAAYDTEHSYIIFGVVTHRVFGGMTVVVDFQACVNGRFPADFSVGRGDAEWREGIVGELCGSEVGCGARSFYVDCGDVVGEVVFGDSHGVGRVGLGTFVEIYAADRVVSRGIGGGREAGISLEGHQSVGEGVAFVVGDAPFDGATLHGGHFKRQVDGRACGYVGFHRGGGAFVAEFLPCDRIVSGCYLAERETAVVGGCGGVGLRAGGGDGQTANGGRAAFGGALECSLVDGGDFHVLDENHLALMAVRDVLERDIVVAGFGDGRKLDCLFAGAVVAAFILGLFQKSVFGRGVGRFAEVDVDMFSR